MRKVLLLGFGLLFVTSAAFSQDALRAGAWSLGAGVSNQGMATNFGYFWKDNIEVNGMLGYNSGKTGDATHSSLGFGVGGAYYLSMMGPGYPFAQVSLGWGTATDNTGASGAKDVKSGDFGLNIDVGYLHMLSEKASVYGKLGYTTGSSHTDVTGSDVSTSMSNMNFTVGLKVFVF